MNFTFENLVDAAAGLEKAQEDHAKATRRLKSADTLHEAVKASLHESKPAINKAQELREREFAIDEFLKAANYSSDPYKHHGLFDRLNNLKDLVNDLHPEVDVEVHKSAVGTLQFVGRDVTEFNIRVVEMEDVKEVLGWAAEVGTPILPPAPPY